MISPRTDPNNRHFRASQNCNFYMNFWISSSQTPRSRRALEDLTQNFEENTIFRGQKFGRKSKLSWFFILFPLLHPFFFSQTSVEFYKISMRDGTPPQRGALMAALTRRFDHFCRNEYGFIEAESDQIFSWEPPLMLPLLGNAWFDHFCLNEYGFIKAKSLKFQDRLAPTTEKRTPNFFNLPWEIPDLSCFTCFPSWFLTSSGWIIERFQT